MQQEYQPYHQKTKIDEYEYLTGYEYYLLIKDKQ